MSRILSWIVTPFHVVFFAAILLACHPLLWLSKRLGFDSLFERFHELHNLAHLTNIRLTFARIRFVQDRPLPVGRPVIFVSNHQSMYDIPLFVWFLRKMHPKFVAKIELARAIPSISFSLKEGGHLVIKRQDPAAALRLIREYGKQLQASGQSVVLFPEGTRARDGALKPFKTRGFVTLLESMPDALIVPAVVEGSWRLLRHGLFPVPAGVPVTFRTLEPIEPGETPPTALLEEAQRRIRTALSELREDREQVTQPVSRETGNSIIPGK